MIFALMTLFGLIVMPFLIWIASGRVLGPYTHGQNLHAGPLALVADYYTGLAHGSAVFLVRGARSGGAGGADPGVHGGMAGVSPRYAAPEALAPGLT